MSGKQGRPAGTLWRVVELIYVCYVSDINVAHCLGKIYILHGLFDNDCKYRTSQLLFCGVKGAGHSLSDLSMEKVLKMAGAGQEKSERSRPTPRPRIVFPGVPPLILVLDEEEIVETVWDGTVWLVGPGSALGADWLSVHSGQV